MRATIDKAGRVVIPKRFRDDIGLRPREVEVTIDGTALRVEPLAGEADEVSAAFVARGLTEREHRTAGDWTALLLAASRKSRDADIVPLLI